MVNMWLRPMVSIVIQDVIGEDLEFCILFV